MINLGVEIFSEGLRNFRSAEKLLREIEKSSGGGVRNFQGGGGEKFSGEVKKYSEGLRIIQGL